MSDDSKNRPDLNLVVGKFNSGNKTREDRKALAFDLIDDVLEVMNDEKYSELTNFEILGILRLMDQAFMKSSVKE